MLHGGAARVLWAPDYRFGDTEREYRKELEEDLEAFVTPGGLKALLRHGLPSVGEEEVRALARQIRYGASPGTYEALYRMNMAMDVRDVLPAVSAPTLVVQQRGDSWMSVKHGPYLAQHIPGAAYVETDGDAPIPTVARVPELLAHVMPFLQEAVTREVPEPDEVLATVMFSDIVGSTARATELGDARWRDLLTEHHTRVRAQLARFRGVELDTAGTGSSPASTARPAASAALRRSATRSAASACRSASACTPASARCSIARWPGSRSRSAPGCPRGRRPVRCWCRRRSKTWSPAPASPSKTAAWPS